MFVSFCFSGRVSGCVCVFVGGLVGLSVRLVRCLFLHLCVSACFVCFCWFGGELVGWLVGWLLGWLVG